MRKVIFLFLTTISFLTHATNQSPFEFTYTHSESNQEDILKARKGQNFSPAFRALVLKVAHEDARDYLAEAKRHFECLKNPSCESDFNENRKVIVGEPGVGKD